MLLKLEVEVFKALQFIGIAAYYGTRVQNRPDRDEPTIEIERMPWRQIKIPLRNPFRERRAGNLDGGDMGAPLLAGIAVETAPPDPFDGPFLTRVGDHEIADREGADLALTTWRADQGTVKEGTATEALGSTMAVITFGYARRSRSEGSHYNGRYGKQVAPCSLRGGALCRSSFHVQPGVRAEASRTR